MAPSSIVTHMFGQVISTHWWLILLLILLAFFRTPFMKGVLGELMVNLAAKFSLDKNVYSLFKNVTLPTEDGTTQIDHIIVSRYGVFVIETKNMKGWIFGSPDQSTWTQKIYRRTIPFQNPLRQNYKHTQTLQSALELDPEKMFSLVVFVGDSSFKTPMPDNVVYGGGYIRFIKNKTQPILSDSEVLDICAKIKSGRLKPSLKTHRDHVSHVKTIVEEKSRVKEENLCPKCGRTMVLRISRNSGNPGKQFWGCSGFPKCKTIRQLT
jgi:restriction system protein